MFLNQYHHFFDDKSRLTIPAKFRELLSEGAFVVPGFDRNLMVLPPAVFQVIYDRLNAMSITDPNARLLRQTILGNALKVVPDGSHRILLSQNLRDYAGLKSEVVFVGQGDYFELWAAESWHMQEDKINDSETNSQRFATLDLRTR